MLTLLIATLLALPIQEALRDGEPHAFRLGLEDPVLEGMGPSKTFRYVIQSDDAVLFLYARSDELDLVLRAELKAPDKSSSGAAALLTGKRRSSVHEDDDSGGGTTPFLLIGHRGGGELRIRVAAKGSSAAGEAIVQVSESRETVATRAAATTAPVAIAEAKRLAAEGQHAAARAKLTSSIERLLSTEGAQRSLAIEYALFDLGLEARNRSDLNAANAAWAQVHERRSQTLPDDHPNLQSSRTNFALSIRDLGDLPGARALQEKVLSVHSKNLPDDHPDLLVSRSNLALTLGSLGDLARARSLQEKVLSVRSKNLPDDHPDLQSARSNLAWTLYVLGDLARARSLQEKVLSVRSQTLPGDHLDLLSARSNLATTIKALGDLPGARALEEKVLSVESKTWPDDHPKLQASRTNLASTLFALGDLQGARALNEKVLSVESQTLPDDHPDLQSSRSNLALTLYALGDLPGARVLFEKVVSVESKTLPDDHPDLQSSRSNLALTLYALGDLARARSVQENVLLVRSQTLPDDHPDLQLSRSNLALTLFALGDLTRARSVQEKVLSVRSQTLPDDHHDLQTSRSNLTLTLVRLGEVERAAELTQSIARGTRGALESFQETLSPREIEAMASGFDREIDTVLSFSGLAALPSADAEAFALVETARVAAACGRRLLRAEAEIGDEKTAELRSRLEQASAEVTRLSRSERSEGLFTAVREKELLQKQLRAVLTHQLEKKGRLFKPEASAIATALAPGDAAVGFWRYDPWELDEATPTFLPCVPSVLAYVVRPGKPLARVELGAAKDIEQAVKAWRRAIAAPTERGISREDPEDPVRARGEELRALVWDPIRESFGDAKRVIVALDGVLHLVPLDALPLGEGIVGDTLSIEVRTSLKELTVREEDLTSEPSLLALGGIEYDLPATWTASEESDAAELVREPGAVITRGAPKDIVRSWETSFTELPATESEVDAVAKYFAKVFQGKWAQVLKESNASRKALEALGPKARFLHIATHGYFAPDSVPSIRDERPIDEQLGFGTRQTTQDRVRGFAPMVLCGLAFAGANSEPDAFGRLAGVMTAEELATLDLSHCELAVLSACDTNVGERRAGQGIASLQQALYAAGARASITSLWKVPDQATRELMADFYRRIWVQKKPKAQALWEAKQKLRKAKDELGDPKYTLRDWAGWVLTGR